MAGETEILDERFRAMTLGNAWLEKLHGGMLWAEGPVYFADSDTLLWSDIPNNRMMQFVEGAGVRVFRQPSNNSNGNTRDRQGRLVTCEHGTRRVTRTEPDGSISVLADNYRGKRLNSPNDVVVKPDGTAFSPDERTLYVADTGASHDPVGPHHIRAFADEGGARLGKSRVFA